MDRTEAIHVHVAIVNYNSASDLEKCLESLRRHEISSVSILDNCSSNEDFGRLLFFLDSFESAFEIRVLRSDVNVGFGAGVNLVVGEIDATDEDALWILNPDTIVTEDCVHSLVVSLGSISDRRIISPVIRFGDSTGVWYSGGLFSARRGRTTHLKDSPPVGASHLLGLRKTEFVTGAAPIMHIGTWRALGGFSDKFFLYWEDAELSLRAQARGIGLFVDPAASLWHKVGGSGGEGRSTAYFYYMCRNRVLVCGAYYRPSSIVFCSGSVETLRLHRWALKEKEGKLQKFFACTRGSFDGLRGRTGRGKF